MHGAPMDRRVELALVILREADVRARGRSGKALRVRAPRPKPQAAGSGEFDASLHPKDRTGRWRATGTERESRGTRKPAKRPPRAVRYPSEPVPHLDGSVSYPAPRLTNKPVIVVIHGGGWVAATNDQTRPWAEMLQKQGYPVVNANYRLAGQNDVHAEDLVNDVAQQVRRARSEHDRLNTSSVRVITVGFSAGGHLAALLAARGISDGAVGFSAPTKLAKQGELTPYTNAFVGQPIAQNPKLWRSLSPADYKTKVPMFLAYGADETLVPPALHGDPMHAADPMAKVVRVPGSMHSSAALGSWEHPLLSGALAYVRKNFGAEVSDTHT